MRLLLLPRWARRLVVIPALVLGVVALLGLLPLWLIVAAFASRFVPGRWRVLRLVWFLFTYLVLEVVAIAALTALWFGAAFGTRLDRPAWQARHVALMGWFLRRVMGTARRTFGLQLVEDVGPEAVGRPESDRRPVLVFSRHAGPGDSIILVDGVLNSAGRAPRIVLKDLLQLDPALDLLLNRIPTRFVPTGGRSRDGIVDAIAELAAGATASDALVLFPEGGNFTHERRARAIQQLDDIGRPDLAERARELTHLLPPKPAGALAAIEASPDADVVFVGHAGLEALSTVRDIWRELPMDRRIVLRRWHVRAEEIPPPEERETWLYEQWELIDTWLEQQADASDSRRSPGPLP